VIDLRTLRPLDTDAIIDSVKKTNRAVVLFHDWPYGGVGCEIIARIQELAFDHLDAPVLRECYEDVPFPYAENLEQLCLPTPEKGLAAVKKVLYKRG
ncbi:MAG TPA: transketolase C-terminal domain-containing protein, partial [Nannocystis sp.]